jgi:peptide/histidine transporter 3/4
MCSTIMFDYILLLLFILQISYTFVSYICQFGIPQLGGLEWSFFVGYSIPCVAMAIAVLIFVSGTSRYVLHPAHGSSVLSSAMSILWEAHWTNRGGGKGCEIDNVSSQLDNAKLTNGGSFTNMQVEAVKLVMCLVPFLGILIPFWGIYSQTNTGFQNQGCQMNLQLSDDSRVPVSALNLFNTIAIIFLVPIFDTYLYPVLKDRGYSVTMLRKMGMLLL